MVRGGVSGNLMSLGALDFGLIVDGAVISAARKLPSSRNNTTITSNAPSTRFFETVAMVRSTSAVRS
ncbi:MAG: hypothetical protein ABWX88_01735 [Pseudoxanthomonas sp.]